MILDYGFEIDILSWRLNLHYSKLNLASLKPSQNRFNWGYRNQTVIRLMFWVQSESLELGWNSSQIIVGSRSLILYLTYLNPNTLHTLLRFSVAYSTSYYLGFTNDYYLLYLGRGIARPYGLRKSNFALLRFGQSDAFKEFWLWLSLSNSFYIELICCQPVLETTQLK